MQDTTDFQRKLINSNHLLHVDEVRFTMLSLSLDKNTYRLT